MGLTARNDFLQKEREVIYIKQKDLDILVWHKKIYLKGGVIYERRN